MTPLTEEQKYGLTEEQAKQARANFAARRGPASYEDAIMGPPVSEELQQEIDAMLERGKDLKPETQALEVLAEKTELNNEGAKAYQWIVPEDFADEAPRIGQRMHSAELLRKLKEEAKLICGYAGPYPLHGGFKYDLRIAPSEGAPFVVAAWVQVGWMPEFTLMHFDPHGIPLNEKARGWRGTVLLQLILKGFLTEELAHQVFGQTQVGEDQICVKRYRVVLHGFRNRARQETAGTSEVLEIRPDEPEALPPASEKLLDAIFKPEPDPEPERKPCASCGRRLGHNLDCPQYARKDPRSLAGKKRTRRKSKNV